MKNIIENNYPIEVIGSIKVNEQVYKIKCKDNIYYLKICDDNYLMKIIDYIESLQLKCFVKILKNVNNEILTIYNNRYFYIMESIEQSHNSFKELKIKYYFELLAYIHNQSFYNIKVNKEYYKRIYHDSMNIINERIYYYDQLMKKCEKTNYRSPSQWLFLLNFYRITDSLNKAKEFIERYMKEVEDQYSVRICLIYKNFNYNHISLIEKKLISIDKMKFDMPIYDIYDLYQKSPDILFDIDCLSEHYLRIIKLNNDEKLLLCTLLHITPVIYLEKNEINNIIKISRLLYYIDSINSLCSQIDIRKPGEFH